MEHLMVEQSNRDGGSVEQGWWNTGKSGSGKVEYLMLEQQNM